MSKLPSAYQWLERIDPLPRMIRYALDTFGTIEAPGVANNPTIMGWAKEVGLSASYGGDAIPWCGLFMAVMAKRAGKAIPDKPLWALSWARFGNTADSAALGDVLVFKRDGGGHVGLYVGEDGTAFHVLGGNQSDRVCFTRIARTRLYAIRRPIYRVMPASAKAFLLAATGGFSRTEA
jgi:uncharacterized protein (TIGR02594 family)